LGIRETFEIPGALGASFQEQARLCGQS
jgi:hypothetical protein